MAPETAFAATALEMRFPAMGGIVHTVACDTRDDVLLRVRALFERLEAALSRFRDDSDLSALNRAGGTPQPASPLLFAAVEQALAWAARTGGVFDPTLLDALEAAGYDRPFEDVPREGGATTAITPPSGRWREIALDPRSMRITLPRGVRLDLGGIGKGFTVDAAVRSFGPSACAMVNASGDLYAAGAGPDGRGWRVAIDDPAAPGRDLAELRVRDRGVATSSTARRWWTRGGRRLHHLIDPGTGQPAETPLAQVTVVAADATTADVLAKCALLSGDAGAAALLAAHDAEAFFVNRDGRVSATAGMGRYLA